jgi:hypothetical protein
MINKNFTCSEKKFLTTIARTDGFFALFKSELINGQEYVSEGRCDEKKYGAVAIRKTPNVDYITTSEDIFPVKDISIVEAYDMVYHRQGYFCIAFIKLKDQEIYNRVLAYEVSGVSKTFAGLIKLMLEWKTMRLEPFNSEEEIAIISEQAIEALSIPQDVLENISNNHADMPVFKFLNGDESARDLPDAEYALPEGLYNWAKESFIPNDYIEIDGEVVTKDDPRITHWIPIEEL